MVDTRSNSVSLIGELKKVAELYAQIDTRIELSALHLKEFQKELDLKLNSNSKNIYNKIQSLDSTLKTFNESQTSNNQIVQDEFVKFNELLDKNFVVINN